MAESNPYESPDADPESESQANGAAEEETPRWSGWAMHGRLWPMMFLQYFVQGCYLPIASLYVQDALGFSAAQIGMFGASLAVGPLLATFVIGQIVDRHFATQKVLAFCHLAGGVIMLAIYAVGSYGQEHGQTMFIPIVLLGSLYTILYMPSMMLTNSLAFHHLKNPSGEFPIIRLWGTVGFILPAFLLERVVMSGLEGTALDHARVYAFMFSGLAGLVMAGYALTLPKTPPAENKSGKFAPGAVLKLFTLRHLAVLLCVSFVVAITHKFFFVWNSPYLKWILNRGGVTAPWEQQISAIGQVSEVLVMLVLGFSIAKLGFKWTMTIGTAAYLMRSLILAGAAWLDTSFAMTMTMVCIGQAFHGICFACFLAGAFIYVDKVAPPDVRGSMQNLYGNLLVGAGAVRWRVRERLGWRSFLDRYRKRPGARLAGHLAGLRGDGPGLHVGDDPVLSQRCRTGRGRTRRAADSLGMRQPKHACSRVSL